jgi:hypothetical protein
MPPHASHFVRLGIEELDDPGRAWGPRHFDFVYSTLLSPTSEASPGPSRLRRYLRTLTRMTRPGGRLIVGLYRKTPSRLVSERRSKNSPLCDARSRRYGRWASRSRTSSRARPAVATSWRGSMSSRARRGRRT